MQHPPRPAYDPSLDAHLENPYGTYAELRAEAPVMYSPEVRAWVVTRYEDVVQILLDTERFSAVGSIGIEPFDTFAPEVQAVYDRGYPRFPGIIEMDPPAHSRYRGLVNLAFTPRRVAQLEPRIQEIADDLIDAIQDEHRIDFIERFAFPLPMTVICEILGVPSDEMAHVQHLADGFRTLEAGTVGQLPIAEQIEVAESFVAFQLYVADMVAARRKTPTDDLLSTLLGATIDGERELTTEELVSTVIHLLFAGQETTARVFGSAMLLLLSDRSRWTSLVEDPSLAPRIFEEALRLEPPVTYHLRRTKVDVELGGVTIPADQPVQLIFASANHDQATFPRPDDYDPTRREGNRHLGFGRGIHFCVGAPVARLEGRVAFETLARRLPGMRLVEGQAVVRERHVMLRGLERLWVEWDDGAVLPRLDRPA